MPKLLTTKPELASLGHLITNVAIATLCLCLAPVAAAQTLRTQATLRAHGTVLESGGYLIETVDPNGPLARMRSIDGQMTGMAEAGDVIVSVGGESFFNRRTFLDLLDSHARANQGSVRLELRDVNSGRQNSWDVTTVQGVVDLTLGMGPNEALRVPSEQGRGLAVPPTGGAIRSSSSFASADPLLPATFSLGLEFENDGSGTLKISRVYGDGPATRLAIPGRNDLIGILEVGDVVEKANDVPLANSEALQAELARRGGRVSLTVRDGHSGERLKWLAEAELTALELPLEPVRQPALFEDELGLPPSGLRRFP